MPTDPSNTLGVSATANRRASRALQDSDDEGPEASGGPPPYSAATAAAEDGPGANGVASAIPTPSRPPIERPPVAPTPTPGPRGSRSGAKSPELNRTPSHTIHGVPDPMAPSPHTEVNRNGPTASEALAGVSLPPSGSRRASQVGLHGNHHTSHTTGTTGGGYAAQAKRRASLNPNSASLIAANAASLLSKDSSHDHASNHTSPVGRKESRRSSITASQNTATSPTSRIKSSLLAVNRGKGTPASSTSAASVSPSAKARKMGAAIPEDENVSQQRLRLLEEATLVAKRVNWERELSEQKQRLDDLEAQLLAELERQRKKTAALSMYETDINPGVSAGVTVQGLPEDAGSSLGLDPLFAGGAFPSAALQARALLLLQREREVVRKEHALALKTQKLQADTLRMQRRALAVIICAREVKKEQDYLFQQGLINIDGFATNPKPIDPANVSNPMPSPTIDKTIAQTTEVDVMEADAWLMRLCSNEDECRAVARDLDKMGDQYRTTRIHLLEAELQRARSIIAQNPELNQLYLNSQQNMQQLQTLPQHPQLLPDAAQSQSELTQQEVSTPSPDIPTRRLAPARSMSFGSGSGGLATGPMMDVVSATVRKGSAHASPGEFQRRTSQEFVEVLSEAHTNSGGMVPHPNNPGAVAAAAVAVANNITNAAATTGTIPNMDLFLLAKQLEAETSKVAELRLQLNTLRAEVKAHREYEGLRTNMWLATVQHEGENISKDVEHRERTLQSHIARLEELLKQEAHRRFGILSIAQRLQSAIQVSRAIVSQALTPSVPGSSTQRARIRSSGPGGQSLPPLVGDPPVSQPASAGKAGHKTISKARSGTLSARSVDSAAAGSDSDFDRDQTPPLSNSLQESLAKAFLELNTPVVDLAVFATPFVPPTGQANGNESPADAIVASVSSALGVDSHVWNAAHAYAAQIVPPAPILPPFENRILEQALSWAAPLAVLQDLVEETSVQDPLVAPVVAMDGITPAEVVNPAVVPQTVVPSTNLAQRPQVQHQQQQPQQPQRLPQQQQPEFQVNFAAVPPPSVEVTPTLMARAQPPVPAQPVNAVPISTPFAPPQVAMSAQPQASTTNQVRPQPLTVSSDTPPPGFPSLPGLPNPTVSQGPKKTTQLTIQVHDGEQASASTITPPNRQRRDPVSPASTASFEVPSARSARGRAATESKSIAATPSKPAAAEPSSARSTARARGQPPPGLVERLSKKTATAKTNPGPPPAPSVGKGVGTSLYLAPPQQQSATSKVRVGRHERSASKASHADEFQFQSSGTWRVQL